MSLFGLPITSVMIAWTAGLSWLLDWKMWLNVIIPRSWMEAMLWMASVRCQEMLHLPNQSVCLSWYFLGRNFIAQSSISRMDFSLRLCRMLRRVPSWLILIHAWMFCLDWSDMNKSFSLVSSETLLAGIFRILSSISHRTFIDYWFDPESCYLDIAGVFLCYYLHLCKAEVCCTGKHETCALLAAQNFCSLQFPEFLMYNMWLALLFIEKSYCPFKSWWRFAMQDLLYFPYFCWLTSLHVCAHMSGKT